MRNYELEEQLEEQWKAAELSSLRLLKKRKDLATQGAIGNPQKRSRKGSSGNPSFEEPSLVRSKDFYLPDGDIVVIVDNVKFRLRLAHFQARCRFFAREWTLSSDEKNEEDERQDSMIEERSDDLEAASPDAGKGETEDGTPFQRLVGLNATEFTEFLRALEKPSLPRNPPDQNVALSLVRAAQLLGCSTVLDEGKRQLRELWPTTLPVGPQRGMYGSFYHTLILISDARELGLTEPLKWAFYELIRNSTFWRLAESVGNGKHTMIPLSDADLLALYRARHHLQARWRELIIKPPGETARCPTGQCERRIYQERTALWWPRVLHGDYLKGGERDPICYFDTLKENLTRFGKEWCETCLAASFARWDVVKAQWWDDLDGLLRLRPPGRARNITTDLHSLARTL
ncbi:hypothetical protein OH77DRAFT_1525299 [Trametes cingulata]|nr:hypothetical protein OH77DRAFT_1525299 [Trametes cingulata]